MTSAKIHTAPLNRRRVGRAVSASSQLRSRVPCVSTRRKNGRSIAITVRAIRKIATAITRSGTAPTTPLPRRTATPHRYAVSPSPQGRVYGNWLSAKLSHS